MDFWTQLLEFSDLVGDLWNLRIYLSNKFPSDVVADPEDQTLKISGFHICSFILLPRRVSPVWHREANMHLLCGFRY